MLEIVVELAAHRPAYAEMSLEFIKYNLRIAAATVHAGEGRGMWNEEDGFFYDVLRFPDSRAQHLKVRSMVGLCLCARSRVSRRASSRSIRSSTADCCGSSTREDGRQPVYGATPKFQEDPHWRDLILCYEYFHGDKGAGLGASHQTGWTGIIARAMHLFATTTAEQVLELGQLAGITELEPARPARTGGATARSRKGGRN